MVTSESTAQYGGFGLRSPKLVGNNGACPLPSARSAGEPNPPKTFLDKSTKKWFVTNFPVQIHVLPLPRSATAGATISAELSTDNKAIVQNNSYSSLCDRILYLRLIEKNATYRRTFREYGAEKLALAASDVAYRLKTRKIKIVRQHGIRKRVHSAQQNQTINQSSCDG